MSVAIKLENFEGVDDQLRQLPDSMRGNEIRKALGKAGRAVVRRAKQLVTPPGYPGDKPGLKPLRDTIGVEVKGYDNSTVAVVGPKRPTGAHGHLVEHGHMIVGHKPLKVQTGVATTPDPFMDPAAEQTKAQQQTAVIEGLKAAVKKATGQ